MKILVTGASGGIGSAICKKFLEHGHEVVGMDIAPATISQEGYTHIIHDICKKPYPEIEGVEVLVNSAGVQKMSVEDIDINLMAVVEVTEHYAFQDKIRAVVQIASASGLTGSEFPHYAASKGGLVAYTKNVALRLAEYGAIANSLCKTEAPGSFSLWGHIYLYCIRNVNQDYLNTNSFKITTSPLSTILK